MIFENSSQMTKFWSIGHVGLGTLDCLETLVSANNKVPEFRLAVPQQKIQRGMCVYLSISTTIFHFVPKGGF